MNPIIGIIAETDNELTTKLWITYVHAVEACGGTPVILPYSAKSETLNEYVRLCDGFMFTGGADIAPDRYGEEKSALCGEVQPYRDEHEFKMLEKALSTGKPILAICRGAQLVNVAFGGTLYQDLPSERPSDVLHKQRQAKMLPSHNVSIVKNTPLYKLAGLEQMTANSFHHQAIKTLGKELFVMATAPDGIIEAAYLDGAQYLRAYQWHPERLVDTDEKNKEIFVDFIKTCASLRGY